MAADNYFPPKIKERALAILQAYRSHMLATTKYKTYGWDRVRNDIMKPYDKPGHRDNRLKPQHLTNFEKSGGRLSDPIFFFVNQFVLNLEKDREYIGLLRDHKSTIINHYEKMFSDFYNVTLDMPDFSSSNYYFVCNIAASVPHKMVCRVALSKNSNLFSAQIIRIPLNCDFDKFSPSDVTDFQLGSLSDLYLPVFGFLLPGKIRSRDMPLVIEGASADKSDDEAVILEGKGKYHFVNTYISGTAKTTLYPAQASQRFGSFDFSFTLRCNALRRTALAKDTASVSPLRPRSLSISPVPWHSMINGLEALKSGEKSITHQKDLKYMNDNRLNFESIENEKIDSPILFYTGEITESMNEIKKRYDSFFSLFFPEPML